MRAKQFLLTLLWVILSSASIAQNPDSLANNRSDSLATHDSLTIKKPTEQTSQAPKIEPPIEIYQTFGEIYERIEATKGYIDPVPDKPTVQYFGSPSIYNVLRARFGLDFYLRDRFTFHITFQSIKYFGIVPQAYYWRFSLPQPLYEAWGEYYFSPTLSIKAGLMPLSYDKERILGQRDWLPQALNHNAILLKYDDLVSAQLGMAFNFNRPQDMIGSLYQRTYKLFQFAWVNGSIGNMEVSLLALNAAFPEIQYVYSSFFNYIKPIAFNLVSLQTFGIYANIGTRPVYVEAEAYYQMGRYPHDWILTDSITAAGLTLEEFNRNNGTNFTAGPGLGKEKKAYMYSVTLNFETKHFKALLGYDLLSGDEYLETGADINMIDNAFDPVLGSIHQFYGAMDYFYMDSWTPQYSKITPGLADLYATIKLSTKTLTWNITGHWFKPANTVYYFNQTTANYELVQKLGYEVDMFFQYFFVPDVASISIGLSALKPTDALLSLRNFDYSQRADYYHAAWIAFRVKPTFYKAYKFKQKLVQQFDTSEKLQQ